MTPVPGHSDFKITLAQRLRLLEGNYKPLVFQGVLEPGVVSERLPHGCKPGARYVLAWKAATAVHVGDGEIVRIPRHPTWFITVTAVEGGPRRPRQLADRPWVVRFDVTDLRDSTRFLRRIGGHDPDAPASYDALQAGALPDAQWLDAHAKLIGEFESQRRLKRHADEQRERGRERSRARRKRAA